MNNTDAYTEKYMQGYGTMFPEGHVIRFYEKFLKYELGITGAKNENLLDFGCGNGTHAIYFQSKGFNVHGVDMIEQAIKVAKQRLPEKFGAQFLTITPGQSLSSLFDKKFDVILANQSLYYIGNSQLRTTLKEIDDLLKPGGVVFFTMMGSQNYYYPLSEKIEDGLSRVTLKGRLNETTLINFVTSEAELADKFSNFKPHFIGSYDCTMREGSGFHYQYVGIKR